MVYRTTLLNRSGFVFALICIVTSLTSFFLPEVFQELNAKVEAAGAPMSPLVLLMVIDWSALSDRPWLWFYIPSWMLTLILFIFSGLAGAPFRQGG